MKRRKLPTILHTIHILILNNLAKLCNPAQVSIYVFWFCDCILLITVFACLFLPRSQVLSQQKRFTPMICSNPAGSSGLGAENQGGGGGGGGDGEPVPPTNPPEKKEKKPPSMTKKAASKVSGLSTKLTDLKCLRTQVKASSL